MRRCLVFCLVSFLLVSPCLAQKIRDEHDEEVDFSAYETFRWHDSDGDLRGVDDEKHERIVERLREMFRASGLRYVESGAMLQMTYRAAVTDETKIVEQRIGSAMRGGRRVEREVTYRRGTLVVELLDLERDVVVWRISGSDYLAKKPEKNEKKLESILSRIGKRWDKIY